MKFCVDECCNIELVRYLRLGGHDVLYIGQYKPGTLDNEILFKAFNEKRILITEDRDFGELVYRLKKQNRPSCCFAVPDEDENFNLNPSLRGASYATWQSLPLSLSF